MNHHDDHRNGNYSIFSGEYEVKKVVRENHKQDITFMKRHPVLECLFFTASSQGRQINLYNNDHDGHLDLVSYYLHDDDIGGVCWLNHNLVGFYDMKGKIYHASITYSRVERIYEPLIDSNITENSDYINYMCSSFQYYPNSPNYYLFTILNESKNVQVWDINTDSCICNMKTDDNALFHFGMPIAYNKFIIIQSNGRVLLLSIEQANVTIEPILLSNDNELYDAILDNDVKEIHLIQQTNKETNLLIQTSSSFILCNITSEYSKLTLKTISHLDYSCEWEIDIAKLENNKFTILIPSIKDIKLIEFNTRRFEEKHKLKHNKKGTTNITHSLNFKNGSIIIAINNSDSSILRFERIENNSEP